MTRQILEAEGLVKRFGGVSAVDGISLQIQSGEIAGLIGPNGSGKTTFLDLVSGYLQPDAGVIKVNGETVNGLRPFERARKRIGRTFQIPRLFSKMTVLENLLAGSVDGKGIGERISRGEELLTLVGLSGLRHEFAENLSGGQKKLLELARALTVNPDILLLDEPVAGVSPAMIEVISSHLSEINKGGVSLLIVEHNMAFVMGFCQRCIVFDNGKKISEGPPASIRADGRVIEAYLGAGK